MNNKELFIFLKISDKKSLLLINEIFYFYFYLQILHNLLFVKYSFFLYHINIYYKYNKIHSYNKTYLYDKSYKWNTQKSNLINTDLHYFNKIINILFLFNYTNLNHLSKFNDSYKLLFLTIIKNPPVLLNNNKFITRWLKSILFIYNIFYFNLNPLFFNSYIFKKESIIFNNNKFSNNIPIWNSIVSIFFYKTNKFSKKIEFFFKKLLFNDFNIIIISDCFFHHKNLFYFNKFFFFSLGLTSANINPWLVSYAIPALINNFFTQFFFLQLCLSLNKKSIGNFYKSYKNLWLKSYYNSYYS